ncbi:MAG TPA: GAP family protein [Conexibacter sp.]|nr:GAP family protein [Conexibacter sp.]
MPLLLLAFEAAIYPTLLAAVVILLTLERPARMIGAYLAGGLTISIGLGCLIVFALAGSNAVENQQSLLSWAADLAIGGLALLAAMTLATHQDERWRERRRARRALHGQPLEAAREEEAAAPKREPWSQRILARGSLPVVFVAALFVNVPGAAYLIALKDIAAGNHSTATVVALILLFNAIMFLLAEIPLAGLLVAPERTGVLVAELNVWLNEHSRQIAIGVCVTLGAFLVVRGLVNAT